MKKETIERAILKQKIRRSHGLIIKEEATLYSTFVEPFTDALGAIKLGTQSLLSITKLAWDTISISPKKINEARGEFEKRQEKIAEKWKPIMDRSIKALQRGDADFLALAFAPGLTLAAATTNAAVSAAGGTLNYLSDAGIKVPLLGSIGLGLGTTAAASSASTTSSSDSQKPAEEKKTLLQKLAGLFYIESSWLKGDLLVEAPGESQQSEPGSVDFKKELIEWMEATGVAEQFKETAAELIESYTELISAIVDESVPKIQALESLKNSPDLDSFLEASKKAANMQIDVGLNASSLEKEIEDSAKKLISSPEYKEDSEELASSKGKGDSRTEDQKLQDARKTIFVNMKKDFDDKSEAKIKELKASALEMIESQMPDQENISKIKTTTEGVKFLKIFSDAKSSVENSTKLSSKDD